MQLWSSLAVALGLSMDNFAVTIASGCSERCRLRARLVLGVSAAFAAAHFVMFSAGWFCGEQLGRYIDRFDHWIAFFVLVFIGARMVKGAFSGQDDAPDLCLLNTARTIAALAVATSLDALLAGVALSLTPAPFWLTVTALTFCVLLTSCCGFWLGAQLGRRFGRVMEALGGAALAAIGTKLLLAGLGIW